MVRRVWVPAALVSRLALPRWSVWCQVVVAVLVLIGRLRWATSLLPSVFGEVDLHARAEEIAPVRIHIQPRLSPFQHQPGRAGEAHAGVETDIPAGLQGKRVRAPGQRRVDVEGVAAGGPDRHRAARQPRQHFGPGYHRIPARGHPGVVGLPTAVAAAAVGERYVECMSVSGGQQEGSQKDFSRGVHGGGSVGIAGSGEGMVWLPEILGFAKRASDAGFGARVPGEGNASRALYFDPMSPPSPPCVPQRLHTHDAEPAVRFEAWRERAHQWVEMQPPPPGAELEAELVLLRGDGDVFGTMRSSAYEMRAASRRLAHAPVMVVLAFVQAGEMRRDAAPGEAQRIGAGALGLFDPWRAGSYRWSGGAREVFLALPRQDVAQALGREPGNLLLPAQACMLAPLFSDQLRHLARLVRRPDQLDGGEYASLLDTTRALALLMLHNLERQGEGAADTGCHAARHAAALRFMERNAHRHDLDAAAIAHGVGCSRTRLYEAFAAHGDTVMAALREMRLQNARMLIEQTPRLQVGALSWRCGFADASEFGKCFRARFGLPPTEWHRRTWAEKGLAETPADSAASGGGARR